MARLWIVTVFMAFLFVVSLVEILREEYFMLSIGIASLTALIFVICQIVKYAKIPNVLLTYDQGKLYFADGFECAISDVQGVKYQRYYSGHLFYWSSGKLIVQACGREFKFQQVAHVEDAHNRLLELMLEAREKN